MTSLGVYAGNDHDAVLKFENWLGREVDFIAGHGGGADWQSVKTTFGWIDSEFRSDAPIYWTVPMLVGGGSLGAGAGGAYDGNYRSIAETLAALGGGQGEIHVRVGQEFNGNWFSWAAKGKQAEYIATFRHFVDAFRSVSDKFVFEWTVNAGDMGMDPATAYPGDKYVDVIGMDFYYNTAWDPKDPAKAFDFVVNRQYGLQWLENFADAHGKPTAYSEWSINSDNAGAYVSKVASWFQNHDVKYQSYYDSNAAFPGKLSGGQYANTGGAFIAAFGKDGDTSPGVAPGASGGTSGGTSDATVTWTGGTGGNDTLTGDGRNNKIDGGGGTDTMIGKGGDDTYTVDRSDDRVVESAGQGTDSVDSYARSHALAANVENLNLVGSYRQDGFGNGLDNRIVGNGQDNVLAGRGGDDWLTGGGGRDTFVFGPDGDRDIVTDFQASDTLDFRALGFTSAARVIAAMSQTDKGVEIDFHDGGSVLLHGTTEAEVSGHFLI